MRAPLQTEAKTSSSAPPTFAPVRRGLLQRKCVCGGTPGPSGECEACRKRKLQRRPGKLPAPSSINHSSSSILEVPPIVHDVLRSPGEPLDAATRAFFEPRFGYDFSRVRVHTDKRAAESARAVDALAYTLGHDMVFGPGQYAPETSPGKQLLAHELTHSLQQRSELRDAQGPIGITDLEDQSEVEAESVSRNVFDSKPFTAVRQTPVRIARQADGQPKGGAASNHAKQTLKPEELKLFATKTKATAPTGQSMAFSEGPRFVLHDTASRVELNEKERKKVQTAVEEQLKKQRSPDAGVKTAEELKKEDELKQDLSEKERLEKERRSLEEHRRGERGPLDEAAAAYVPSAGEIVIARPNFFDPRRPTATQYERRNEIVGLKDREETFQKIWKATKPVEQAVALKSALSGLEISPKEKEKESALKERAIKERKMMPSEITGEQTKAKQDLEKTLSLDLTKKGKPQIGTTASWVVGKICEKLRSLSAADLANSAGQAKELEGGCSHLQNYLAQRDPRIGSSVNVEIIQPAGSACETNEKKFHLVPLPLYTENQYQNVALFYLQAALQAGQFPEITTHFWLDRGEPSGHCDPRCFKLAHLYDLVADSAGHAKGSTYGDPPNPGITRGTNNVWWHPKVCSG